MLFSIFPYSFIRTIDKITRYQIAKGVKVGGTYSMPKTPVKAITHN